ncbi:MAG: DUF3450 domain-containing protein [Kangiellaceae bacterium]|nr:DUF3450 domain-containing protein [Kangiellaceae bacterium]
MFKITLSFLLTASAAILQVQGANTSASELDNLVLQWTQLEQQHSELDNRWRENKPVLEQQLQLLSEEKKQLQSLLDQHTTAGDEVEKERFDLLQQQTEMEETQQRLEFGLAKISSTVVAMHKRLPPPLKQQWDADIRLLTIGQEPASTGPNNPTVTNANVNTNIISNKSSVLKQTKSLLSNSEKLDKLLSLLNKINQFEQRVALHQTTMQLTGSKNQGETIEVQVDQVYLGTSQGWYISKDGRFWGAGNSGKQGWQWRHQDTDVDVSELRQTVKMLTDPASATLVSLPINIVSRAEIAE